MTDQTGVRNILAQLSSSEHNQRQAAAAALYRMGCELGDAGTSRWLAAREWKQLLSGSPTVGLAVPPDMFERIRAANGSPRLSEVPPDQDAIEFELHFDPHVSLDILTTNAPGGTGAIARFLARFGEGIQQVEYPTTDVDHATEILRTRFGEQPVYAQTRPGADGTRVNFFLARTPEGTKVLIELVEAPRESRK